MRKNRNVNDSFALLEHRTQEIKAEVFNYQQINKMETINSIRQFCNEGPVKVGTEKTIEEVSKGERNCLKLWLNLWSIYGYSPAGQSTNRNNIREKYQK